MSKEPSLVIMYIVILEMKTLASKDGIEMMKQVSNEKGARWTVRGEKALHVYSPGK